MRKIENETNRALKYLYKNLRFSGDKKKSNTDLNYNFSRVVKASEHEIKTHTFIHDKLEKTLEEKLVEVL